MYIQSIDSKYDLPSLEPILTVDSLTFIALNILTFGIYGTTEIFCRQYQIKQLKIDQKTLQERINLINEQWNQFEKDLNELLAQLSSKTETIVAEKIAGFEKEFQELSRKNGDFQRVMNVKPVEAIERLSKIFSGLISFIGQLLANVLSLGLYGIYQNYSLKDKIVTLEKKNSKTRQFSDREHEKKLRLQKIIQLVKQNISIGEEFKKIENTDQGRAYKEVNEAKKQVVHLQNAQLELKNELNALRTQKAVADLGKQATENDLAQERARTKDLTLRTERLRNQLTDVQWKFDQKVARVQALEKEISNLKNANKNLPEIQKMLSDLTPIPSKYAPREGDGIIKGAFDINIDDRGLDRDWVNFAKEYKERYKGKRNAAEIVEASFNFALGELLKMAKGGDKIKLNDSAETMTSPGSYAVYNYMILDFLKGGAVEKPVACEPYYGLKINSEVWMLPSFPKKDIRLSQDENGTNRPEVIITFSQYDDFTPMGFESEYRSGVDCVGAKWILERLNDEEKNHLFNLLMRSVIENTNLDYQKTREYMQKTDDPRVQLIQIAHDLITDMGALASKKFISLWNDLWGVLKGDQDPFIKEEEVLPDFSKIKDTGIIKVSEEEVEWTIDQEIFKEVSDQFSKLISRAQGKYKTAFRYMQNLVTNPKDRSIELVDLNWEVINEQYYISHKMIGVNMEEGFGGQRCLFSNLLAIFLSDLTELTSNLTVFTNENVRNLRKAMANYLDILRSARWGKREVIEENKKLKELAKLDEDFEKSIFSTHGCDMPSYQAWLRGSPIGAANIDLEELTEIEIQLCAFMLGVKIGVLAFNVGQYGRHIHYSAKVDKYGKVVPINQYYGPNTKESLLMVCSNKSYYGLFPKLNLKNLGAQASTDERKGLVELEKYWFTLDQNRKSNL